MKLIFMRYKLIVLSILIASLACTNRSSSNALEKDTNVLERQKVFQDISYNQIKNIPLPDGFERTQLEESSFANWLEDVPLKKDKTVYKYDGTPKYNQLAQFAVLDISVGTKDLQQCADAVMRLRAEYLFAQKRYDEIVFIDNANKKYAFSLPYNRENFAKYLESVFGMCGSASLAKQLKFKNDFIGIEAGDVIIRGGFPGHAVIVMDIAKNKDGEKIYLLAQSYMPAQDIHVLINPMDENLSPWYKVSEDNIIKTPEYLFYKKELMKW